MEVLVDFGALREHLAALNAVVGVAFDRVGVAALELDKSERERGCRRKPH